MRTLLLTTLLLAMSFAGCLGDGDDVGTDGVTDSQLAKLEATEEERATKPVPRFEPTINIWSDFEEYEPASNVFIHFNVTDREDNPYPATFIDWGLFYERSPTPVAEGDGNELPGSFNRTLFGESYHLYALRADDGQGFKDTKVIIVQTGQPEADYPDANRIQNMINITLKYYGEWEPPVAEDGEVIIEEPVEEGAGLITRVIPIATYCVDCVETLDPLGSQGDPAQPMASKGCKGFVSGVNFIDCAWVNILPASWGEEFTVSATYRAGNFLYDEGEEAEPQVEFLDSCRARGQPIASEHPLSSDEFIPHSHAAGPVTGIIPEGARCMVAFELNPSEAGVEFTFEYTERPGEPFGDPWFHPTVLLGYAQVADTQWYDGVFLENDVDSGCIGNDANCGPTECPGLATNQNGLGCAWIEVTPNMVGNRWSAISPADNDGFALSECSPDATVIETYGDAGPESGYLNVFVDHTILEGTGCLMVSDYAGYSGLVQWSVIGNP